MKRKLKQIYILIAVCITFSLLNTFLFLMLNNKLNLLFGLYDAILDSLL